MTTPTNPTARSLAERAIASKHWRWMERMVTTDGLICGGTFLGRPVFAKARLDDPYEVEAEAAFPANPLPNLCDPATLGCLLRLVREAWGQLNISTRTMGDDVLGRRWCCVPQEIDHPLSDVKFTRSEAEALVAALEAAK